MKNDGHFLLLISLQPLTYHIAEVCIMWRKFCAIALTSLAIAFEPFVVAEGAATLPVSQNQANNSPAPPRFSLGAEEACPFGQPFLPDGQISFQNSSRFRVYTTGNGGNSWLFGGSNLDNLQPYPVVSGQQVPILAPGKFHDD